MKITDKEKIFMLQVTLHLPILQEADNFEEFNEMVEELTCKDCEDYKMKQCQPDVLFIGKEVMDCMRDKVEKCECEIWTDKKCKVNLKRPIKK